MFDIENRAVLVTGGSRGLGRALSEKLAEQGARVVLVARNEAALREVAAGIVARGGVAHAVAADVADKFAVHPLAATATALVGPIDVLIHNASDLGPTPLRSFLDTECEDLEQVLQTNVVGPFRLSKIVAGSMALHGRGTIVHVSSDASVNAYPGWGSYSVSKAASDHMARLFASELGPHGVRVFSVDPGEMDTSMHRAALPDADPQSLLDPGVVAGRIVSMLKSAAIENGARLEASLWKESS